MYFVLYRLAVLKTRTLAIEFCGAQLCERSDVRALRKFTRSSTSFGVSPSGFILASRNGFRSPPLPKNSMTSHSLKASPDAELASH